MSDKVTFTDNGQWNIEPLQKSKFVSPEQQKANKLKAQNEIKDAKPAESIATSAKGYKGNGPRNAAMSKDPSVHSDMASVYDKGSPVKAAHEALAHHWSGKKKLGELDVRRHQKTLWNEHYKSLPFPSSSDYGPPD
jgi:hypothetical protein